MLRDALLSVSAIAWIAAGQLAMAQTINPPPVPANLRVPEGNTPFVRGSATQNYVCLPAASGLAWAQAGSIQFVPYTAEYVFYQNSTSH